MNQSENKTISNAESQLLVIFGANGDLANRKLLPAIFQLFVENLLPEKFAVVGSGSNEKEENTFREEVKNHLKEYAPQEIIGHEEKLEQFLLILYYKRVNNKIKEDFDGLKSYID